MVQLDKPKNHPSNNYSTKGYMVQLDKQQNHSWGGGGGGGGGPNKFWGSKHRQILQILVFFFYSYFKLDRRVGGHKLDRRARGHKLDRRVRGHKCRGQKLRNFGPMTTDVSDENAKNFATFFRPDRR